MEYNWTKLMNDVSAIEELTMNDEQIILESIGNSAKFILEFGTRIQPDNDGSDKFTAIQLAVNEFNKTLINTTDQYSEK